MDQDSLHPEAGSDNPKQIMCWSDRDEPAIAVSDNERDESDLDMPLRSGNRSGCALSGTLNGDSEHDTPCSNKG